MCNVPLLPYSYGTALREVLSSQSLPALHAFHPYMICVSAGFDAYSEDNMSHLGEEPMRQSRFTEKQIVAILREADRSSVTDPERKHKLSEQTVYIWHKKVGVLEASEVECLKTLETENAGLKRMLAEREMAIDSLKDINRRKWRARRSVVRSLRLPYRAALP
jgi:putative transposase